MMIDVHSHLLPGLDDGAPDVATALAMARAYVADGVGIVVCTPHIVPGVYVNSGPQIRAAVAQCQIALDTAGIDLHLLPGADVHVTPRLVEGLKSGHLLSLADSRYVLIELPHHVAPPRFEDPLLSLIAAGYVPILTHPERMSWMAAQYQRLERLVAGGLWIQVTTGALGGIFGRDARQLAERMLDDGLVHLLATDAHNAHGRPPDLRRGFELAAGRVGEDAAWAMVATRPRGVLENVLPSTLDGSNFALGDASTQRPGV